MKFLFIHQNFPGQFRHIAIYLASDLAHQVVGLGDSANIRGRQFGHERLRVFAYDGSNARAGEATHHYVRDMEGHVRRGQQVARALFKLREEGFVPDVVVAHPAWGEALFVRDVFPESRFVAYFEYFYHGSGGDLGFDPEFPSTLDDRLRVRIRNSTQLIALADCDEGISPTQWQRGRYPGIYQEKIRVLHEGVDTRTVAPDPDAWLELNGMLLRAGDEVVTYVARNLEPYRGFHTFIRALPSLLAKRPRARVIVVGGDDVSYGRKLPNGETYRTRYCAELGEEVDWSRVHFVGKLPYGTYLKLLQVSACHVYLTYPFVLSWSMLEAMAAGCVVVGSATAPVQEVIRHGENGLLVDFFDGEGLADRVGQVLGAREDFRSLGVRAREFVVEHFDLHGTCLPRLVDVLLDGRSASM